MDGYFENNVSVCVECHFSCATCENLFSCLSCSSDNKRNPLNGNQECKCTAGYFENNTKVCGECHNTCAAC